MQIRTVFAAAIACAAVLLLPSCGDGSTTDHTPWVLGGSVQAYAQNSTVIPDMTMSARCTEMALYDAGNFRQPLTPTGADADLFASGSRVASGAVSAGTFNTGSVKLEVTATMLASVYNTQTGFTYFVKGGFTPLTGTCTAVQNLQTGQSVIAGGLHVEASGGGAVYVQTAYVSGACFAPPLPPDGDGYVGPDMNAVYGVLNKSPRADVPVVSLTTTPAAR